MYAFQAVVVRRDVPAANLATTAAVDRGHVEAPVEGPAELWQVLWPYR